MASQDIQETNEDSGAYAVYFEGVAIWVWVDNIKIKERDKMCDNNNKLKIYKVNICQSFEIYYFKKGLRYLFSKNKRVNEIESCDGVEKYILAHNLEEAIEKYKQLTNYVLDECIDYKYRTLKYKWDYSYFSDTKYFLSETPNYKNEYCGCEVSYKSFNFIKDNLTSEDFIAYYKQEMYPVE